MKAFIKCAICGKSFECNAKESPESCAKRHGLFKVELVSLKREFSEQFYLCKDCVFLIKKLTKG